MSLPPRRVLPPHAPGMRIGLFGGTFDPPHAAHLGASLLAMKRLQLDRIWWLVTPGNPLKDTRHLASLDERIAAARKLAPSALYITGLEAVINTRYTYDTLDYLVRRCPGVDSSGSWAPTTCAASSLAKLARHREPHPMAVVDRMGSSLYATGGGRPRRSPATVCRSDGRRTCRARSPAWVYLHGLKSPLSSTALRAQRKEPVQG